MGSTLKKRGGGKGGRGPLTLSLRPVSGHDHSLSLRLGSLLEPKVDYDRLLELADIRRVYF